MQVGRFARPCARSTYAYTSSGRSPAQLASTCFGPLGAAPCGHFASLVRSPASRSARLPSERLRLSSAHLGPDSDRAWHLGYWEAILAPRRSLREKPSPLPAPSRRYAAQYFVGRIQPPRLAPRSAAHTPNRGSVFSLRSRLVPRPASRTTLAVAFLSLILAAPLSHRLSADQSDRACLSQIWQSSGLLRRFRRSFS